MIFSLVVMTGLEKCYITSAYLHSLCHSGERPVARGPLVLYLVSLDKLPETMNDLSINGTSYKLFKYKIFLYLNKLVTFNRLMESVGLGGPK